MCNYYNTLYTYMYVYNSYMYTHVLSVAVCGMVILKLCSGQLLVMRGVEIKYFLGNYSCSFSVLNVLPY